MAVYKEVREDRAALVGQMKQGRTVNVDGYPLSLAFYEQLSALKLAQGPRRFEGPCLLVQVDRAESARPLPEVASLAACYADATHVIVQEEPFWKEIDRFYEDAPEPGGGDAGLAGGTMSARMHPVRFANRQGLTLVGIVHEPSLERGTDVAIVLLSPGIKNRVAPHRLYNKMADRFVQQGYWVLRFDFYGLGDSEGVIGEEYLADLYGSVGLGRYVGDTWAAMDWMRDNYPVQRFIVGGLCGGAITGVLAAPQARRCRGPPGAGPAGDARGAQYRPLSATSPPGS